MNNIDYTLCPHSGFTNIYKYIILDSLFVRAVIVWPCLGLS